MFTILATSAVGISLIHNLLGVAVPSHLTDQMRAALEREDPALDEGDEEVGGHEALRLLEHPESADGVRCIRRHRLRFVAPVGPSPSGRAGLIVR